MRKAVFRKLKLVSQKARAAAELPILISNERFLDLAAAKTFSLFCRCRAALHLAFGERSEEAGETCFCPCA
jgi:hypothetical protein